MESRDIQIGLRIRVVGAPDRQGSVGANPQELDGRWYVRVNFDDGVRRNTPVEHLEILPDHRDAISEINGGQFQGPESLRRNLLHEKLNGRLSDVVYSMDTSDTTFYAYQFKPVLKLLESPTNSLLIADEVGLGKTIEAGLIWTELKAREAARSLLVVCPPHLVSKWQNELKRRFGVDAMIAGAEMVLAKLDEARRQDSAGFALIATYHGLRPPRMSEGETQSPAARLAKQLDVWGDTEEPFLDLLVMDEAAIMRNAESQTSKLGGLLAPISRYKVYLSATPLHTRASNLFTLLRRLDPDTFPDEYTFATILQANAPLVALRKAIMEGVVAQTCLIALVDEALRSPLLKGNNTLAELRERIVQSTNLADPKLRAELAYQSERANLLSYVVTRTRRRDVDEKPVLREVNTVRVRLSRTERELYRRVTESVNAYADENGVTSGFLTVMPQRQVSSCMAAAYSRFCNGEEDGEVLNPDFTWDRRGAPAGPLVRFLRDDIAREFDYEELRQNDSKYQKLREAIRHYWQQHQGGKIVLFAYFKATLYYLKDCLRKDGIESLLLTGDETRNKQDIVDEFSRLDTAPILLSSEVGSEGLDLQFASALVNYDLPWNPMVVEQRIGRIHRIGQKADRIVVINIICEQTVDERIYDRLYDRLGLFQRTLGDLEAVIGPLINELTKDLLSLRLSDAQEVQRIEDTAVALEAKIQLEEELERNASVLAAYGDYVINQIASAHSRGEWINAGDLESYVRSFFRRVFPATSVQGVDHEKRIFEITFDSEAVHHFDSFLNRERLRGQTQLATLERRQIRFDHRVFTSGTKGVEIVHQAHPLIRFIGHHLRVNRLVQPVAIAIEIAEEHRPSRIQPGLYVFVSQRWTADGLRSQESLQHEVRAINEHMSLSDSADATALVEIAAALGQDCGNAPQTGDDMVDKLASVAAELELSADAAYHRFLSRCERENEDRQKLQLHGIERFEHRRKEAIEEVRSRHQLAGRGGLVAAMGGQLDSLRLRCEAQRMAIERKKTTGDCATLAAGFILVH
jgi:superfamily II DNA or RNA helicase